MKPRRRQRKRSRYFEGRQSPEDQDVASVSEAPKSSTFRVNSPAFVWPPVEAKVPSPVELKAARERAKVRSPFRNIAHQEEAAELARGQAELDDSYSEDSEEEEETIARVFQVKRDDFAAIARVQTKLDDFDLLGEVQAKLGEW